MQDESGPRNHSDQPECLCLTVRRGCRDLEIEQGNDLHTFTGTLLQTINTLIIGIQLLRHTAKMI